MNRIKLLKSTVVFAFFFLCSIISFAQTTTISGTIRNEEGEALIGVTIVNTTSKAKYLSDNNGSFSVEAKQQDKIEFSFVGYQSQIITITNQNALEVIMLHAKENSLTEVVVTALGIKKEQKRLGYAVQSVKGEELIKAREPNPINSLVGKVAGLTVGVNAEMLRAPTLILRGNNINLFVVDGVPINSDTWNISPDDIESYTILKGATASALYGSRGLNGAIMITTKRGTANKRGFVVEFNSSTMVENGFNAIPKVQDEYGPGDHGKYAFVDGKGGGTNDGDYDIWGPKFEGQLIPQYDSPVDPNTGVRSGTPWVARGRNNLQRFLQPGLLSTNNLAIAAKGDRYDLRFSVSHTYQKGIVPNMKLNMTNFNISAGYDVSNKIRLEGYLNYNKQYTPNFPDINYGPNSLIYNIILWGGADWNIDDMRNYWQPGKEGVQSIYAEYQRYHNPYFMVYEWLRGHYKTDINGSMKLNYKIARGLDAFIRSQVTTYDLFRNEKMPWSAHPYGREEGKGDYREDRRSLFENNTDFLITYHKEQLANFIDFKTSIGGNARNFKYNSSFVTTDYLNTPGSYTFANSRNSIRATNYKADMLVLSGYGLMDIGFDKYAYLSLTGRFDKLSTLPEKNNVGFYPSASLSTVISDYVTLPNIFSLLKLRFSVANVKGGGTQSTIGATPLASYPLSYGNEYYSSYDGPTYQNAAVYRTPIVYNNLVGAYYTDVLNNPDLKVFSTTAYETGLNLGLLKNRLGLDVTYFLNQDGPGIFSLPVSQATGYNAILQNGITTKKTGWEVSLNAKPIATANGFTWATLVNWSTFKEIYTNFYGDLKEFGSRFNYIGGRVDAIVGSKFIRTPDGQLINDAGGRPIRNPQAQLLGYGNPDWVWSFINTLSYKGVSLGFQFDGRVGGNIINYIQQQTFRGGRHIATIEGEMGEARYQDYKGVKSWKGPGVVVSNGKAIQYDNNGAITNYSELQYAANTSQTFLQDYISFYYATNEANLISKTFGKLREVTISYQVPSNLLKKSFINAATISLVGRNLLYFSKYKDLDLDQYPGSIGASTLQTPTTKRYGININISF